MERSSSTPPDVSHDDTAARARELWYSRNCPIGQDEEIWLEAERQLKAERQEATRTTSASAGEKTPVDIDQRELTDRLDNIGDPQRRSTISIDPTR